MVSRYSGRQPSRSESDQPKRFQAYTTLLQRRRKHPRIRIHNFSRFPISELSEEIGIVLRTLSLVLFPLRWQRGEAWVLGRVCFCGGVEEIRNVPAVNLPHLDFPWVRHGPENAFGVHQAVDETLADY
jgi:hypothetical protein